MSLDPLSPEPLYVQLADAITKQIQAGKLVPRRPIPSEEQLRQEFGVARGTVRQAVKLLRERGLVVTVPQRGTYVAWTD
ncbi:winged helix-turn-helix domain-containing protein [Micromonospora mirobrigensis]|uniref:Regulatory protein, gntR family n=1 Tax=Micromonospora mirobrigensis TaxID=262898 RepID=A0A1C4XE15_9ACTN|nr:winged helix-turn-helix domain-containing protein [Micromonospora mirobrigensis]SCF06726.1 regulatory protein, gntR family [Micromonospora mirobrigensis]